MQSFIAVQDDLPPIWSHSLRFDKRLCRKMELPALTAQATPLAHQMSVLSPHPQLRTSEPSRSASSAADRI